MVCYSRQISRRLSNDIRLIMTDVDDTITAADGSFSDSLKKILAQIQQEGILVGLISGRNMADLQACAVELDISGPLVAENGGQVRFKPESRVIYFGNQEIVDQDLKRLKERFGSDIVDGDWNRERLTDKIIGYREERLSAIAADLEKTDIIETSYSYAGQRVLHLVEKGISKGATLTTLIRWMEEADISPQTTLVLGDGPNDLSMFRLFPHSVLIPHDGQPIQYQDQLQQAARYFSNSSGAAGFIEVAVHILNMRF